MAKVRAEKANKLKTKMNKSEPQMRQVNNWKIRLSKIFAFTGASKLWNANYRATQQTHLSQA